VSDTPTAFKYSNEEQVNEQEKRKRGARGAMIVGRIIGWLLIVAAVAVLVRDALAWIDGGSFALIAAGELWFRLHQDSLQIAEPAIARHIPYIGPWLWHPVISTILTWPAVLVIGVPGLVLSWAFRPRPKRTGMFKG
jgi:hypothetical protein